MLDQHSLPPLIQSFQDCSIQEEDVDPPAVKLLHPTCSSSFTKSPTLALVGIVEKDPNSHEKNPEDFISEIDLPISISPEQHANPFSLNEFPNEILSFLLGFVNSTNKLWTLRVVCRRWKYIIHQILFEKTKNHLNSFPNSLQLLVCQINERSMKFFEAFRIQVTEVNTENGQIIFNCEHAHQSLRLTKKSKLFLVVRKKTATGLSGSNNFRVKQRKEMIKDGRHFIEQPNSYAFEYNLIQNRDVLRAKSVIVKNIEILSFVASPVLILESAILNESTC
ncbi:hypothetical protein G9A89_020507 [Geosiphon pyriformis]|nr:hypothetical protein G9A89_020507 [Geosiphon pyriformis]